MMEEPHMNNLHRLFWGILLLSALLLSGCAKDDTGKAPGGDSGPAASSGLESNSSAEPISFTGTDLEGNSVSADAFAQSKLTMVNVWESWRLSMMGRSSRLSASSATC